MEDNNIIYLCEREREMTVKKYDIGQMRLFIDGVRVLMKCGTAFNTASYGALCKNFKIGKTAAKRALIKIGAINTDASGPSTWEWNPEITDVTFKQAIQFVEALEKRNAERRKEAGQKAFNQTIKPIKQPLPSGPPTQKELSLFTLLPGENHLEKIHFELKRMNNRIELLLKLLRGHVPSVLELGDFEKR